MTSPAADSEAVPTHSCDVLVLGAGIAAHQAAIAAAKEGVNVTMVGYAKGASPYILGFNVPLDRAGGDSEHSFFADTLAGGYGIGDRALIRVLSSEAVAAFMELQKWGVPFESRHGQPVLRHLSGSRLPRSVFVKTGTGTAVLKALERQAEILGVKTHRGLRILRLLKSDGVVVGALAQDRSAQLCAFQARSTVLASGGIGQLYGGSTYPSDVVGDSYALALDVGARLIDMEFVQFEPTVVSYPASVSGMEMPTAMLGDGAVMTNSLGERFMCRYNPVGCERQIEKARMALHIQTEIDEGRGTPNGSVWFDATGLATECLHGYVTHHRRLVAAGIDPAREPVQVKPAAHSLMGGVKVDECCFSGVPGLYACGEAAAGPHGASRIAGNGATDAIVLSRVAGRNAAHALLSDSGSRFNEAVAHCSKRSPQRDAHRARECLAAVRGAMSSLVGMRRSGEGLRTALESLGRLGAEVACRWDGSVHNALLPVRNAAMVAYAITQSALMREESRGAHFRSDFPESSRDWHCSIQIQMQAAGQLVASIVARKYEQARERQ